MIELLQGNCVELMRGMADGSVHCCVTSPPYFQLRDYGIDGQIGLERTPDEFVAKMVEVFREVRRVLRDDGTLWLNLGDSYGTGNSGQTKRDHSGSMLNSRDSFTQSSTKSNPGKAPVAGMFKQLLGIPWRVAFALQADGWYLRSDIIWHKPNPMPESVRDRPTKSHEYLFLLSKSERYYFDADAVREPLSQWSLDAIEAGPKWRRKHLAKDASRENGDTGIRAGAEYGSKINPAGRNIRSVWTIATEPYEGAHFATFPGKLVEPCVRAGTSERGCCPRCGKPSERVVEVRPEYREWAKTQRFYGDGGQGTAFRKAGTNSATVPPKNIQLGWRPACSHGLDPVPCVVLDPFAGSGTVGVVADALGRRFIGIDLKAAYLDLARRRIERPHLRVPRNGRVEHLPLFDRDDASSPTSGEHP